MRACAIAQNTERSNHDDAGRHQSPSKPGPGKPSAPKGTDHRDRRFLSRQRKGDNIPALATPRQMLQNLTSFSVRQRALRERCEYIRVGMIHGDRRSLQPFSYDFG
jgi:hypothetical protein